VSSRKIEDGVPELQEKYHLFSVKMGTAGIPFMLTRVACFVNEQVALYSQGRQPLDVVNFLRRTAGLSPIPFTENCHNVTWTLASKHIIDLDDGNPDNDKARAFDIAILKYGMPVWDLKVNVNKNDIPDYNEAGQIGESVGLKWGGRFPKPDRPHFQI
jgi:peptidoglycan L-alanyl-D-glutamate endopeptidase CwlK